MTTSYEPGARIAEGIPLCVPDLAGREWEYVKECLDTGWVSSVGAFVTRFETQTARAAGAEHAVATTSGTAALHVALLLAGVEPGDEVLVSALTFIAPANAIRYTGAHPIFVDAEPHYWQIDLDLAEQFLERCTRAQDGTLRNPASGRRVRALLVVDILGHPVDLDRARALGERFELALVEDATESLGASYRDRPVGGGTRFAALSFNGNKLITTGGGGMLLTDDAEIARRARYLTTQAKDDPIESVHGEVGYNYRLPNVLAAIGCAQVERLATCVATKRANAARYAALLDGIDGITPMPQAGWARSTYWLYTILVDEPAFGMSSRALLRALAADGIQARPLWQPLHRSPAHRGAQMLDRGVADRLGRDALSIPSSVGLSADELARVAAAIRAAARPA